MRDKYFYRMCMMMMMIVGMALLLSGCRKLIATPPPMNEVTVSSVFSNDKDATLTVLGLYNVIMNNPRSLLNGGISIYCGLSSDELYRTSAQINEDPFYNNSLTARNPLCSNLYFSAYTWIYQCNDILEKLSAASGISDSTKRQLEGEAAFMRGLIYFYLVNLYGDVPLVTNTDYAANALLPRTPFPRVYDQIVFDLRAARGLLSETYVSEHGVAGDRTRPNRSAVTALLARVYLYQQDWASAENMATAVINLPLYRLESDLNKVFLSNSQEGIWQLEPVYDKIYTAEGNAFIPPMGGGRPTYALTSWWLKDLEAGDQRVLRWTADVSAGTHYSYPVKYKAAAGNVPYPEYNMVLRLAEQYLIRAEARLQLGKSMEALADVNVIRRRAGLPPSVATDILAAIRRERKVELFTEWGHRWLDLKRWGQLNTILLSEKQWWQPVDALYPLPFVDLQNNPNLLQNPGY